METPEQTAQIKRLATIHHVPERKIREWISIGYLDINGNYVKNKNQDDENKNSER